MKIPEYLQRNVKILNKTGQDKTRQDKTRQLVVYNEIS